MRNTLDTVLALQLAQGSSGSGGQHEGIIKKELPPEPVTEFELFDAGVINSIRVEGNGFLEARLIVDGIKEYEKDGNNILYDVLNVPLIPDNPIMRLEVDGDVEDIRIIARAARLNLSASVTGNNSYVHTQEEENEIWEVEHNLGIQYPIVLIFEDDEQVMADVDYVSKNLLVVTFPEEKTGKVKVFT